MNNFITHFTKGFNNNKIQGNLLLTTIKYLNDFNLKGYYIFVQYPSKSVRITGRMNDNDAELKFDLVCDGYLFQASVDTDLIVSDINKYSIRIMDAKEVVSLEGTAEIKFD